MANRTMEKICLSCEKTFTIPISRDWREHCCSSECKKNYRDKLAEESRIARTRNCKTCGKQFVARQWQLDNSIGIYCSNNCALKAKRGVSFTEDHKIKISTALKKSPKFQRTIKRGRGHHQFLETIISGGYRYVTNSEERKVQEHRLVIEKILGRKLKSSEIVHHIDGDRLNNDPKNLTIVSRGEHASIHARERRDKKYYHYLKKAWETQGIFVENGSFILGR